MKFDLTKKVQLEPIWQKRYLAARWTLWIVFLLATAYLGLAIFFPSQSFSSDTSSNFFRGYPIYNIVFSDSQLSFDAFSKENFSSAQTSLSFDENSADLAGTDLKIRKTYKAFSYPESNQPIGFRSGSLLKNKDSYYIVSNAELRKFSSLAIAEALGFSTDAFPEVTAEEMTYNANGPDITDARNYPDGSAFVIDGTYYQLKDQVLYPFISQSAFHSFFEISQAITKGKDFLNRYAVSDQTSGFADGTLLSFDTSAFVVSQGKILPFSHPETFLSFGYDWNDIIPANEEEIGLYLRDKIFSIERPHPDGTVFKTTEDGKFYLVKDGKKWPILGREILKTYLKGHPISVAEKSLEFVDACKLQTTPPQLNSYQCSAPVANFRNFPGNDYQFGLNFQKNPGVKTISLTFSRSINWPNMRDTLSTIKSRILNNYGYGSLQ